MLIFFLVSSSPSICISVSFIVEKVPSAGTLPKVGEQSMKALTLFAHDLLFNTETFSGFHDLMYTHLPEKKDKKKKFIILAKSC